jgi:histidinol-phosphate/aromatic aminotransferase/cobyric acid decarboxylase-like protein
MTTSDTFDRRGLLAEQIQQTEKLNAFYEGLAFDLDDGDKGNFLSGWQCRNPYHAELFRAVKQRSEFIDYGRYTYFDDDTELPNLIKVLHERLDGRMPQHVFCGSGSTSLLFGFATFLQKRGVRTVYFIPPMYFTLHLAFDRLGIRTIPVANLQPFEPGFTLSLPLDSGSVLMVLDPVWYAGMPLPMDVIEQIGEWQRSTHSYVFVDGSLQYLSWNATNVETSARLDPSLTFRLVCPSKQLCAHGYRFSYVLVPLVHKQEFAWVYTNIYGPVNADSIAFAHEAILAIMDGDIPRRTMALVSFRHNLLRRRGIIQSPLTPSSGYFVFEKINTPLPADYIRVDGRYFDQPRYPDHTKLNLLSPSINVLYDQVPAELGATDV